ncbi:MFS transporter [Streptomyces sp. SHP 1-2]|uniref:MFS transporter n=1 Tax=Streptomyces sp. SHP 1-2 TaxID=2769489 RepID=UPI0022371480|nr:MFS transporter [Streptomyces sp. SHP 1-2]MCW5253557.1 MFS transporter [Streptomyces sp. SHP 1-2]
MSHWKALRSYSALPASAGYWFLAVTLIGRIPATMGQLGSLLLVSGSTGSLALGGAAASAFAVGQAAGGPVVGRLADRRGHRPTGLAAAVAHTASLVALVLCADHGAPVYTVLAASAAAGCSVPQVGPLSRARWTALAHARRLAPGRFPTAMSFEGTSDELAFVLGPALVGVIAAATSPRAALLTAAALTLTICAAFALHPTARLVARGQGERPEGGDAPVRRAPIAFLSLALVCLGCYFGSVQAAITWRAADAGAAGSAGLIYAVLGLSSAMAGALVPMLPAAFTLPRRLLTGYALLALLSVPLVLTGGLQVGGLGTLGLLIALPGIPIAPVLVTAYTLAEATVPARRISWIMTVLSSSVVIGYAIGAILSGSLADRLGPLPAFLTALGAAAVGTVLTALAQGRLRSLRQPVAPAVPDEAEGSLR